MYAQPTEIKDVLFFYGHEQYEEGVSNCTREMYAVKLARYCAELSEIANNGDPRGTSNGFMRDSLHVVFFEQATSSACFQHHYYENAPLACSWHHKMQYAKLLPDAIMQTVVAKLEDELLTRVQLLAQCDTRAYLGWCVKRLSMLNSKIDKEPRYFDALLNYEFARDYALMNTR